MKNKILIFILVLGLFFVIPLMVCGVKTNAAGNDDPGIQNSSFTAPSGYEVSNLSNYVSSNHLILPNGYKFALTSGSSTLVKMVDDDELAYFMGSNDSYHFCVTNNNGINVSFDVSFEWSILFHLNGQHCQIGRLKFETQYAFH